MTVTLNVHEAKTRFSELLVRVGNGDRIIIARAGHPGACLTGLAPQRRRRTAGSAKGKIILSKDFESPLSAKMLKGGQNESCH
jgi:prevent-host-death family protein